mgnify:CR=1 FL=1
MKVTSYQQVLGGSDASNTTASATGCLGEYPGNDVPYPNDNLNIGLRNDGLFNWLNGAFVGDAAGYGLDLQSIGYIDRDGQLQFGGPADDPGWINLGKMDSHKVTVFDIGKTITYIDQTDGLTKSKILAWRDIGKEFVVQETASVLGQPIITDDFFSCTATGSTIKGSCIGETSGTWSLTPPADGPDALQALLKSVGFDDTNHKIGYFDSFAITLKAGNAFAAYLFTAEAFKIDFVDTVYNFFGTFTTAAMTECKTNKQGKTTCTTPGLSHIGFYARDPVVERKQVIPEPTVLSLLGLGLLGIGLSRRLKAV